MSIPACFICDSTLDMVHLTGGTWACGEHMNPPESQLMAALSRAVNERRGA